MRSLLRGTLILTLLASPARADAPTTRPNVIADFHRIIDRPAVDLAPTVSAMPDHDGLAQQHFTFVAEPGQVVPGIVVESKQSTPSRRPVVIVLHGTGGTKEQNLALLTTLAQRGFLAIAIDARYHGERSAQGKGTVDYYAAIAQAYADGRSHPWLFDEVYDLTRLIDYLQTRDDIDPTRIGLMGFSKGGMETWLAAAIEPRIAVAVPCISTQSFAWGLAHDAWHDRIGTVQGAFDAAAKAEGVTKPDAAFVKRFYDHLLPGIDREFDGPSVLPLIAPRPLLVINGETDPINPLPGARLAIDAATVAYQQADAADHFRAEIEPGVGHDVKPAYVAEAVEWFTLWLKPTPTTQAASVTP